MKTGFKDRTKIKVQREEFEPKNGVNSPWDFRCPQYDERSSSFINAGTYYGIGARQPVGHLGQPVLVGDALPQTRRDIECERKYQE